MRYWILWLSVGCALLTLPGCRDQFSNSSNEPFVAEDSSVSHQQQAAPLIHPEAQQEDLLSASPALGRIVYFDNPECVPGMQQHGGISLEHNPEDDTCFVMAETDHKACRDTDNYSNCAEWQEAVTACTIDGWQLPDLDEITEVWAMEFNTGTPLSAHGMCLGTGTPCSTEGNAVPSTYWAKNEFSNFKGYIDHDGTPNVSAATIRRSVRCIKYVSVSRVVPWFEEDAQLFANDAASSDNFGQAVAVSADGRTIVVGAPRKEDQGNNSGGIYIFEWLDGTWSPPMLQLPSDGISNQYTGWSVAISPDGKIIAAGAYRASVAGLRTGAVYLYKKINGQWQEIQKLLPPDAEGYEYFGWSITFQEYGDLLAIGAILEDSGAEENDPEVNNSGAVYIFQKNQSQWKFEQKIKSPTPFAGGLFGSSVSFDQTANHLIIGAPNTDRGAGAKSGSAEVWKFNGQAWEFEQELVLPVVGFNDRFGTSVAIASTSNRVVVGAIATADGTGPGTAYLFEDQGAIWSHSHTFEDPNGQEGADFGKTVAISQDGDEVVIGAPSYEENTIMTGRGYHFKEKSTGWREETYLIPTNSEHKDFFGAAIAINGDGQLLVGGAYGDDELGSSSGSVYLFGEPLNLVDQSPPGLVSDLRFYSRGPWVDLFWQATGDDGDTGRASTYEIRYATEPIVDSIDCDQATEYPNSLIPGEVGASEELQIYGLSALTTYHFCVRALDEEGNPGPWSLDALADAAPVTGDPQEGVMVLPFSINLPYEIGQNFRVTQSYNGPFSHQGCEAFALDFVSLPEADPMVLEQIPIHAVAKGKVIHVKEDSEDFVDVCLDNGDPDGDGEIDDPEAPLRCGALGNRIEIDHGHGFIGRYLHLKHAGAFVQPGDEVSAGELIGHSGQTGFSTEPHLHFNISHLNGLCDVRFPFAEESLELRLGVPQSNDFPTSANDGTLPSNFDPSTLPLDAFYGGTFNNSVKLYTHLPLIFQAGHTMTIEGVATDLNAPEVLIQLFDYEYLNAPPQDVVRQVNVIDQQTFSITPMESFEISYQVPNTPGSFHFTIVSTGIAFTPAGGYRILIE